jgi:predicted nucleotidyltransferase
MKNLYKILALKNEQRKKYFQDPLYYGKEIKKTVLKLLPDARLLVFGSAVKGEYRADSDFDVLIITNKKFGNIFSQAKIKVEILKHFPDGLFEIHIASTKQFKDWYSRFIKTGYLEA